MNKRRVLRAAICGDVVVKSQFRMGQQNRVSWWKSGTQCFSCSFEFLPGTDGHRLAPYSKQDPDLGPKPLQSHGPVEKQRICRVLRHNVMRLVWFGSDFFTGTIICGRKSCHQNTYLKPFWTLCAPKMMKSFKLEEFERSERFWGFNHLQTYNLCLHFYRNPKVEASHVFPQFWHSISGAKGVFGEKKGGDGQMARCQKRVIFCLEDTDIQMMKHDT